MGGQRDGILACIQRELCAKSPQQIRRKDGLPSIAPFIVPPAQGRRFSPFESDVISFRKVDPISPLRIPTFLPLFRCPPTILKSLRHPSIADFPFINSNFTVRILSLLLLFSSTTFPFFSPSFSFYILFLSLSLLYFVPRAKHQSQFNERGKMIDF